MSTSESIIQCQHLQKSFHRKAVLSDISFSISKGQIFGLLGPSGAGKTTLIKILTGQLSPDGGSITVLGKKAENLTGEDKRKMGIMMDQFGLYERLTCADNLNIYADIYGISHRSAADTLAAVGLADSLKKPAASLAPHTRFGITSSPDSSITSGISSPIFREALAIILINAIIITGVYVVIYKRKGLE